MNIKIAVLFSWMLIVAAVFHGSESAAVVKPVDTLRIGTLMKQMNKLEVRLKDEIVSKLEGESKKKMKELTKQFSSTLREGSAFAGDSMMTIARAGEQHKAYFHRLEATVSEMKKALPEKSEAYHELAKAHLPLYKATQQMEGDRQIPLVETYYEAYNPNTTTNNQVMIIGAYLNHYLEYRISVGGIQLGPDIVDPERVVFTFPDKLLEGIQEPTYVEVKAAPYQLTAGKAVPYKEQTMYLLVYPRNKK